MSSSSSILFLTIFFDYNLLWLCILQLEDVEDEKKNADRVKAAVMENVAMDFVSYTFQQFFCLMILQTKSNVGKGSIHY